MALNDWKLNFDTYVEQLTLGRLKPTTVKNYSNWLRPYVEHLVRLNKVPDSQVIKLYLDQHYTNSRTYRRVGAQLVKFTNNFLTEKLNLIAPTGGETKENRLQMPEEHMRLLFDYLNKVVVDHEAPLEHRYKYFGKWKLVEPMPCCLCLYFSTLLRLPYWLPPPGGCLRRPPQESEAEPVLRLCRPSRLHRRDPCRLQQDRPGLRLARASLR